MNPLSPDPCAWSNQCDAITTQQEGATFYEAHANDQAPTGGAAILLLVATLALAFLVMSNLSSRKGRRDNYRKGHQ